ncbi:MAG: hypothetical protein ACREIH_09260, partial [Nitrospiraceae bacterium]
EQNREERQHEALRAERMVKDEVGVIGQWLRSLEVVPTIVALRNRAEEIKRSELDKTLGRLGNLSPEERGVVEGLASAIVNKLLHGPLVTLKAEAHSAGGTMFVEAARRFFNLDGVTASAPLDEAGPADRLDDPATLVTPVRVSGRAGLEHQSQQKTTDEDT